jgi:hypothetical protein
MPLPSYVVELQFGASSYVDVTQYVQSISIGRGINRVLDDFSAGSLSITFVNNSRVFDPLNTSSPLWYAAGGYTMVQPAGQIRVSSNSIRRFTGYVQTWDFTYGDSGFDGQATLTALDFLYKVSNATFTGGTQYEVEATSDRIKSVMKANSFGTATYADVYGGHTLIGYDENLPGDNVLSYLQNLARSEPADLFSNASANMEMKDRSFTDYVWNNTSRYNFVTYPATATILDNTESITVGVNRSGWELIGTQATATTSAYGGFVWRGGTVADLVTPANSYVGFAHVDYNPTRYVNAGGTYTFAGLIRGAVGNFDIAAITLSPTGQGQTVASTVVVSGASTAWNAFSLTVVENPVNTVGGVRISASISGGTTFSIIGDGFIVEPAGTSVNYFDGDWNPYAGMTSASTAYEIAWAGTPRETQSGLLTSVASAITAPAVYSFADANAQSLFSGTAIYFTDLQVVYGSEQLYNDVQVVGINSTAVTEDTTSQSLYGLRGYSQTDNLTTSTTKPAEIASAFLGEFRLPEYRAEQMTIALEALSTAHQNIVLGIEIRDVVRVAFKPSNTGASVDKYYQVLGMSSNSDVERDAITFNLASLDNLPFRLDSTFLGVLDTDTLA